MNSTQHRPGSRRLSTGASLSQPGGGSLGALAGGQLTPRTLGSFQSSRCSVSMPLGQFQEHPARCAGYLEGQDVIGEGAHAHIPCPTSGHPARRALHDFKNLKNQDATVPALVANRGAGNQQHRWERHVREGENFSPHPAAPYLNPPLPPSPGKDQRGWLVSPSASPAHFSLRRCVSKVKWLIIHTGWV